MIYHIYFKSQLQQEMYRPQTLTILISLAHSDVDVCVTDAFSVCYDKLRSVILNIDTV